MGKDNEVKVLSMWASPFCMRVKIALAEKGVAYEEIMENDLFGDKSPLLLKCNPVHKQVPVLLHGDKPVLESTNIITYIDQVWTSPALLPACAYEKSRARFWADFIDRKVFSAGREIWMANGEQVESRKTEFLDILMFLDGTLGDKDYFTDDTFGLVDILLIGVASWFCVFEKYGNFTVEDHYPKLAAWIKRCNARQSVLDAQINSDNLFDMVSMIRQMNGLQ
uniref:glutathione transferase n=1 Tax=Tanacetum cinerariifolium TaxID=118510 RepID=A0A699I513_TANCI|nr:probable glutathione S-transferase [Tanacetum cinerariifolium]